MRIKHLRHKYKHTGTGEERQASEVFQRQIQGKSSEELSKSIQGNCQPVPRGTAQEMWKYVRMVYKSPCRDFRAEDHQGWEFVASHCPATTPEGQLKDLSNVFLSWAVSHLCFSSPRCAQLLDLSAISIPAAPDLRENQMATRNQHVSCSLGPMGQYHACALLHELCDSFLLRGCISVSRGCPKCKPNPVKQYHHYFSYAFLPFLSFRGQNVTFFSILKLMWSRPSVSLLFYQFSPQSDWFWGLLKIKRVCCCFSQDYLPLCSIIRLSTKSTHTTATPSIF